MPSLRRTMSSPSVRSSPYPSLSNAVNSGLGARGSGHRRSSGSETSIRRVLADIEWWRVADGQRDLDVDQESEDQNLDQVQGQRLLMEQLLGRIGAFSPGTGAERPFMPAAVLVRDIRDPVRPLPTDEFAALSITPHTPHRRHHSRQSSLESTPEAPEFFNEMHLGFSDIGLGFPEANPPTCPARQRGCRAVSVPSLSFRSHSFSDFLTHHDDAVGQYADFAISPLSSASPFLFN